MTDKKVRGKPFKPGQSGNPAGRPVQPQELKDARAFNKQSLLDSANRLMFMTRAGLQELMKSPQTNAIDLAIAGQLLRMAKGEAAPSDFKLFDRTLGSVNQNVEVNYSGNAEVTHKHDLSTANLTDEQFEILAQINAPRSKPEPAAS